MLLDREKDSFASYLSFKSSDESCYLAIKDPGAGCLINPTWFCNGIYNCPGCPDEDPITCERIPCTGGAYCSNTIMYPTRNLSYVLWLCSDFVPCGNDSLQCIYRVHMCDGMAHCRNGWDEDCDGIDPIQQASYVSEGILYIINLKL